MEVRRLDRKIAAKKQARSRYHAAFENGDLEPALCNARLAEIHEELAALETRRALVHSSLMAASADFPGDAIDRCLDEIEESDDNPERIKALMRILVKKIVVGGENDIHCTYRLPVGLDGEPVRPTTERVEAAGGGGGNRTRVRSRTVKSLSKLSLPLRFALRPVGWRTYRRTSRS